MKRNGIACAAFAALLVATVVSAGSVYDRSVVSLPAASGTASWTNTAAFAAVKLDRIWVTAALDADAPIVVTRVTYGGAYTQAVVTVTCTNNAGSDAGLTCKYLSPNDRLEFTGGAGTSATVIVEYEVQKH